MKLLLILRHARAGDAAEDRLRPLRPRGRADAERLGPVLRDETLIPEMIVSSDAVRALTTAERVGATSGYTGEIRSLSELYLASAGETLAALSALPDELTRVMVVGHNPGLSQLASVLLGRSTPLVPAALAAVKLPIESWRELGSRRGDLVRFWQP